jgi:translation initiation factor 1
MDGLLNYQHTVDNTAIVEHTSKIHIRVKQMGRKWLTTLEGLDKDLDQHKIAKAIAKTFHCASVVRLDDNGDDYIKIQGNKKDELRDWLVANEVITERESKERLQIHGV